MSARVINLGEVAQASVDRLKFTISKDGESWLDIDSVQLTFEPPGGDTASQFSRSCSLLQDNIWYYDTTITDFTGDDSVGYWRIKLKVTDGSIVKPWPYEIGLEVLEQP